MMVKSSLIDKKAKKQLIKEAEMEFKLRGKFKRVFPSIDYSYYKQFFTEERLFNVILDEKLMSKRRLGNQIPIISGMGFFPQAIVGAPSLLPPLPPQVTMK
jgi:hypothetical protein